jgi:aminomethyltransferase
VNAGPVNLKRTPLYAEHKALGGKLVEFSGWEMPVQYTSVMDEHHAVRKAAGLFDISHMGEIAVNGDGALDFLNGLLTNDLGKLQPGRGQYTLMCNDQGGVIDDLYVYRLGHGEFLLIVNASRVSADFDWITHAHGALSAGAQVRIANVSDAMGAVAVQGPAVAAFVDACFNGPSTAGMQAATPGELKKNEVALFKSGSDGIWVSRTGYTGEDGFEVVAPAHSIVQIWKRILEKGREHGIKPAGLGARDTLRTEACYPLYGHELDQQTTPIEAGLSFFVAMEKGEFAGRKAIFDQKTAGAARKLVAFKSVERGAPPRPGYVLWSATEGGQKLGVVTSGTQSPTLGVGIGMGYVLPEFARMDSTIYFEARGRRWPVVLAKKPIYRKPD